MAFPSDDSVLKDLLPRLAADIGRLKGRYEHFASYDPAKAVVSTDIHYEHGVRWIPNPDYKMELEDRRRHPYRLRRLARKEIPSYPPKDGISLSIMFEKKEIIRQMQRVALPYAEVGDFVIEVNISGAETEAMKEIRKEILEMIDREKARVEK